MSETRTFGTAFLEDRLCTRSYWVVEGPPHVTMMLRRVFEGASKQPGRVTLAHTPRNCADLEWFCQRYPLDVQPAEALAVGAQQHREGIERRERILAEGYVPRKHALALPLRDYQARAVDLYLERGGLLLADDVGLGKTAVGIASFTDPRTLPAVVVTLSHLPRQWQREIEKFAPGLRVHVATKGSAYELPTWFGQPTDVLVLNYHKLAGWADELEHWARSIVFDECQELRRQGSNKYCAARQVARACDFRLGLSATPIYNVGSEFWNVTDILAPGELGTYPEFYNEWCTAWGRDQGRIVEPAAFGTFVREEHLMLRRTRRDVGRELPAVTRIPHTVDSDTRELARLSEGAGSLARIIVERAGHEKGAVWEASGRFESIMRQATGVAKAPFVAEFVRLLVEDGEHVVLCGWHRQVYEIWQERLEDLAPAWLTGSEAPNKKAAEAERFVRGETPVLFMSLRTGAGLDGLQTASRTIVFGELDWSPGVHEQCIGRINRDGQADPVVAYYLLADDGADPVMAEVLGVKRDQIEGIRDPDAPLVEHLQTDADRVRRLAEAYLGRESAEVTA